MSTQLSFIAVRESKDSYFSTQELDLIKSAIQEYSNKNSFKKDPILNTLEIYSESFKNNVLENNFSDKWYQFLDKEVLDKIFSIAKYKGNFWIDLTSGKILDKMCAERWFSTTSAREIYTSILENQLSTNLFDMFSWYKLTDSELTNLSKTFTYIRNGLKSGQWNLDEEYDLGCSDFVNSLGLSIYDYETWQNRNLSTSLGDEIEIYSYQNKKETNQSIASLIRLVRDIWKEDEKKSEEDDEDDEYDSNYIDAEERFRYLNIVETMVSFFKEVYRLKDETKEYAIESSSDIIKVLAMIG